MKLRSFQSVVSDICSVNFNDDAGKYRPRVSRALRNALNELGAHLPTTIKSGYFTVSEALTIQLPDEASDVTKVGTMCDGAWTLMSRNDSVRRGLPEAPCSCNTEQDESCAACTFFNIELGGRYGEAYGVKANILSRSEFRHNKHEHRLEFSGAAAGDQVLVEYKIVGSDESLSLIQAEWVNMLGSYVGYQLNIQNRPGVSQAHKAAFLSSWSALKSAANPYTGRELIAALMGESMPAPKN